jgi:LacI family transcriptional regulator
MHLRNDHAVLLIERNVVRSRRPSPAIEIAPPPPKFRRVLLRIDLGDAFARGVMAGVARYHREHPHWSMCIRPDVSPVGWSGEGVIACGEREVRCDNDAVAIVRICGSTPAVCVDDAHIARLAATHLLERGMREFAFVGPVQRGEPFRRTIERHGKSCSIYAHDDGRASDWDAAQQRLSAWIGSQPKPIGILAADDATGLAVLDACRRGDVAVPDDVAVIGVGNDETLCDLAIPPLSSIDVNAAGAGYEAASLLDRLMDGGSAPNRPIKLAPRGVITRRSTDTVAAEDEEVARAVLFIRERACGGLQVGDVLAHTGMSRASLQQRMKQLLGRTIHQEIQRARLNRAKHLLAMSGLTIKQVARESGFASVQYMTRVFRAETGETPARFRVRRSV